MSENINEARETLRFVRLYLDDLARELGLAEDEIDKLEDEVDGLREQLETAQEPEGEPPDA